MRQSRGEGGNQALLQHTIPHNIRMHLTGYDALRPLPPAGDAGRLASKEQSTDGYY
jgi:hypothetical protein